MQDQSEEVIGDGHTLDKSVDDDDMYEPGDYGCHDHAQELRIAGEAPDALVETQEPEYYHAEGCVDETGLVEGMEVLLLDGTEGTVKAQPQRCEIGCDDSNKIIPHQ